MDTIPRQGPFWLAVCSGLLLLPTALWTASGAWSGPLVIAFWELLPLALVVIVLIGAWAARTAPQPGLWGKIILGSSFLQFFLNLYYYYWWPTAVTIQIPALVLLAMLLFGVILGMMSGIWLIAEHSGSSTQT